MVRYRSGREMRDDRDEPVAEVLPLLLLLLLCRGNNTFSTGVAPFKSLLDCAAAEDEEADEDEAVDDPTINLLQLIVSCTMGNPAYRSQTSPSTFRPNNSSSIPRTPPHSRSR